MECESPIRSDGVCCHGCFSFLRRKPGRSQEPSIETAFRIQEPPVDDEPTPKQFIKTIIQSEEDGFEEILLDEIASVCSSSSGDEIRYWKERIQEGELSIEQKQAPHVLAAVSESMRQENEAMVNYFVTEIEKQAAVKQQVPALLSSLNIKNESEAEAIETSIVFKDESERTTIEPSIVIKDESAYTTIEPSIITHDESEDVVPELSFATSDESENKIVEPPIVINDESEDAISELSSDVEEEKDDDDSPPPSQEVTSNSSGKERRLHVISEPKTSELKPAFSTQIWMEIKDGKSGRMYYYNVTDKKSTWIRPEGFDHQCIDLAKEESKRGKAEWVESLDSRERVYFFNLANGESRWDRPPTLALPEVADRLRKRREVRRSSHSTSEVRRSSHSASEAASKLEQRQSIRRQMKIHAQEKSQETKLGIASPRKVSNSIFNSVKSAGGAAGHLAKETKSMLSVCMHSNKLDETKDCF